MRFSWKFEGSKIKQQRLEAEHRRFKAALERIAGDAQSEWSGAAKIALGCTNGGHHLLNDSCVCGALGWDEASGMLTLRLTGEQRPVTVIDD